MNQTTTNDKYSLAERLKRVKKTRWIRFSIVALLYIGWTIWLNNYYVLFGLLLLIDIYLTQYIPWGWWKTSKNPVVRTVMEWVDAIVYALVLVYFIFIFVFQNYQIPSSSLEKSLLVGDFLLVSKMSYGPRVPNTPLHFPLAQHTIPLLNTKSYIEWPQWDYHRLKGFGPVKRNDIVVFNFPAGDTVAVKQPNPDYYTLCFLEGREAVNRNKALYGDIIYRPVDRRENYVKRCVGLPGDTFSIVNNDIYIDGVKQPRPKNMQLNYLVRTNGRYLGNNDFEKWGISVEDRVPIDVSSLNARMNLESWGLSPQPRRKHESRLRTAFDTGDDRHDEKRYFDRTDCRRTRILRRSDLPISSLEHMDPLRLRAGMDSQKRSHFETDPRKLAHLRTPHKELRA